MAHKKQLISSIRFCTFAKKYKKNWITEATQKLEFYDHDQKLVGKSSDIKKKYYYESKELVKMRLDFVISRFNFFLTTSIFVTPIF